MAKKKLIQPDGGWGWVIVFAYGLNHLVLVPIIQSFGLVFKDTFVDMGFSATDGSVIINTNAAASMMTGLINGPLLKLYGYRKISFAGAFFTTAGVILTAYANSFSSFLITYGLVTSLGMGMGMSSYPLALNTYFVKNRSKAAGITMTITGLGPVLMPQLISFLMMVYDVKGTMLIIGSVAAHSFIAAALLQPVKWHMIEEVVDEENGNTEEMKKDETTITLLDTPEKPVKGMYDKKNPIGHSILSIDHDLEIQAIYGYDTPLAGSVLSLTHAGRQRQMSISSYKSAHESPLDGNWWSTASIHKSDQNGDLRAKSEAKDTKYIELQPEKPYNPEMTVEKPVKEESCFKKVMMYIVNLFDLTLLKDPIYVNIMLGMSLAVFAEINFSILTPFILVDFGLNTSQIATFLSVLSIADILFRFFAPFIGDFLNKPARIMYMFSLLLLISTRFTLLLFEQYYHLLGVAVVLGVAKGVRTVYWTLVIPNYVPIERLATASGLQMVVNGIFILVGGPLLGLIRDATGSYAHCIFVMNLVTLTTVIMWTVEIIYLKYKERKRNENQVEQM